MPWVANSELDAWLARQVEQEDQRRSAPFRDKMEARITELAAIVQRTAGQHRYSGKPRRAVVELGQAKALRDRHLGAPVDPKRETGCSTCGRLHVRLGKHGDEA